MSDEQHGSEALIPARYAVVSTPRANSLVARARADLQLREEAAEWLRKGIQLLEEAMPQEVILSFDELLEMDPKMVKFIRVLPKPNELRAEAFSCFQKGHELDPLNPELLCHLAWCYQEGIGVPADEQRSDSLYLNLVSQPDFAAPGWQREHSDPMKLEELVSRLNKQWPAARKQLLGGGFITEHDIDEYVTRMRPELELQQTRDMFPGIEREPFEEAELRELAKYMRTALPQRKGPNEAPGHSA